MFDTFIFDFDLTLADSSQAILVCFKHTLAEFGFEIPDDRTIYNTIGLTLEQAFTVLCGVDNQEKLKEIKKVYVKKADEVMAKQTVFYENAVETLAMLREKGFKVGIVSTKYRYRIVDTFHEQGKTLNVDEIIGGEDVLNHKPDPSGLNMIIEKLCSDKKKTLYVGDSYIDALTARNADVSFAGVTTGSTTRECLSEYNNVGVFDSVFELVTEILKDS